MTITYNGPYSCKGPDGRTTKCHLRIFHGKGRAPVALLAEIDENSGLSITGAIETLVQSVWNRLDRPAEIVWIEHYRIPLDKDETLDTFDLVEFSLDSSGWLTDPQWKTISRSCVEEIAGCPVE
jgi:hypothetical protein